MGTASIICGIIALLMSIFSSSGLGIVGVIIAILGIIFGAIKKNTAGIILSVIALFLNVILFIACAGCAACAIGSLL